MIKEFTKMTATVEYKRLLTEYCPQVIDNDDELERLTEIVDELVTKGIKNQITVEEKSFLKLLTLLIEEYENEHYPVEELPPNEMLRGVLEERGLRQKDLVSVLGSEGAVSETLSGKRPITLKTADKLAAFFDCPRHYFI